VVDLEKVVSPGVILISPYDPESPQWVRNFNCRPIVVESHFKSQSALGVESHFESQWALNVEGILNQCGPETVCILLVSPNAPTGVIYDQKNLEKLVDGLNRLEHKPVLIVDCVFIQIEALDGWPTTELCKYEKSVFCYSLGKDFGVGGSRVGCLCVSSGMREYLDAFREKNQSLGFSNLSILELAIFDQSKIFWDRDRSRAPSDLFWPARFVEFQKARNQMKEYICNILELKCELSGHGPPYALAMVPEGFTPEQFHEILASGDMPILVGWGIAHGVERFVRFCLIQGSNEIYSAYGAFLAAHERVVAETGTPTQPASEPRDQSLPE
jgi:aspartate/methionine/tyrosine aminotransferase